MTDITEITFETEKGERVTVRRQRNNVNTYICITNENSTFGWYKIISCSAIAVGWTFRGTCCFKDARGIKREYNFETGKVKDITVRL